VSAPAPSTACARANFCIRKKLTEWYLYKLLIPIRNSAEMSQITFSYDTVETVTDLGVDYLFVAKGKETIIKIIQYTYVQNILGKKLYNLGFGDYDLKTGSIWDSFISNNNDHYRTFQTVLYTIPKFFNTYPDAVLMVRGSDSRQAFADTCRLSCKKKCPGDKCRNSQRRIRLYQRYVEKNYDVYSQEYVFLGSKARIEDQIVAESYQLGEKYYTVLFHRI
jgi:hypothetical protein